MIQFYISGSRKNNKVLRDNLLYIVFSIHNILLFLPAFYKKNHILFRLFIKFKIYPEANFFEHQRDYSRDYHNSTIQLHNFNGTWHVPRDHQ